MKAKYLLSMLLGGTMLAACSMDDDLTSAQLAQDANPSSPVFSVSFEDDSDPLTRAIYENNGVKFELDKDLLSLYHNIGDKYTVFDNIQNAIYVGGAEGNGEENTLTYSTRAYVMPGNAIMIYPADITDAWMSGEDKTPVVEVKAEQDKDTKKSTPYMSDILEIGTYTKDDQTTAGYNKKYDIVMRRAASTLYLKLNGQMPDLGEEGLDDIVVNKVSFVGGENSSSFTEKAQVVMNEDIEVARGEETEGFWALSPKLKPVAGGATTLSTEDVDKVNNIATFTLLPTDWDGMESKFEGDLVVETNYGKITVASDDEDEATLIWKNPAYKNVEGNMEKEYLTTNAFMTRFMPMLGRLTSANETFKGEYVGKYYNMTIDVPFTNIDMNNMHVENAESLKVALKVYAAFNKGKGKADLADVTLILDGDEDGLFEIGQDIWETYVMPALTDEDHYKITLAPCGKHGVEGEDVNGCVAVVLTNNGTAEEPVDVPALKLGTSDEYEEQTAELRLAGENWLIDTHNNTMALGNVSKLVVEKGAGLTLVGSTSGVTVKITSDVDDFAIVNKGTIDVKDVIRLETDLDNYGTLNINGEDDRLRMAANAVLTNKEYQAYGAENAWKEGGVINNSGTLTIIENSGAKIYNYGTLNIDAASARTLITRNGTTNETTDPAITKGFSADNKLGTIWLNVNGAGKNNLTIEEVSDGGHKTNSAEQGFVKYKKSVDQGCDLANYVVLDVEGEWESAMAYVQIDEDNKKEITIATTENTAVLIPEGTKIFIPKDVTLTTKYLWLKGFVTRAGKLNENTTTNFEGYFGGEEDDVDKIDSYK